MQAIRVKYLGPTNTQGARLKATSSSGLSVTVGRRFSGSDSANEREAVVQLCKKLGWHGCDKMIRAGLSGDESVFVFLPESCSCPASAFQGTRRRSRRRR